MKDEQILEVLRKLQINCAKQRICEDCKFHLHDGACQIRLVLKTLDHTAPYLWELNKTAVALEK